MASFKDVLIRAIQEDKVEVISVNRSMIELSKSTQRKSGFIKVAVDDDTVTDFMNRKSTGFMLSIDGDELNKIAQEIDGSESANSSVSQLQ